MFQSLLLSSLMLGTPLLVDSPREARPALLDWATKLVQNVQPGDSSYRHKDIVVRWKGTDGATAYESHADCSGFLNELLRKAYHLPSGGLKDWLHVDRPVARTYFTAILEENRFLRIPRLKDAAPGDILAIRYAADDPENTDHNSGHVLIIAAKPQPRQASDPRVDGTDQWEVVVIDQSRSGHGKGDTRHNKEGKDSPGLGQGVLRIYTLKDGTIAGHTWSILKASEYRDQKARPMVIGRLQLAEKP